MYSIVLALHNVMRWVVLIAGLVVFLRALNGWISIQNWVENDRRIGSFYTISIDIQFLLGLVLFIFLSPLTRSAFQNPGSIFSVPDIRSVVLEHTLLMVLAVIFAHVGNSMTRKDIPDNAKFRSAALFFGLSVLFVLLGIPWSRALLPGLG